MVGHVIHTLLDPSQWSSAVLRHIELSIAALLVSILVGIPLGAWLTRVERAAFAVVSVANLGRTIPSLALLALVYPFVGTGALPAIIALAAMGIPPVLVATYTGVREVDADVRDAARGMGFGELTLLTRVELPMASSLIVDATRTSAVQIVASATLASLIGGGGLGEMIMSGLNNLRYDMLVTGSILVALLALATELAFAWGQRRLLPAGIRLATACASSGGSSSVEGGYAAGDGIDARRWLTIGVVGIGAILLLGFSGQRGSQWISSLGAGGGAHVDRNLPPVTIGSKDFTEQLVLGELYAQALQAQGYRVTRKLDLGATAVADNAVRDGQIDMYPEYTGTALYAVLKQTAPSGGTSAASTDGAAADTPNLFDAPAVTDPIYRSVASGYHSRGLTVFAQTPFSNGNTIVVTAKTAKHYHLTDLSDLAKVAGKLRFAAVPGFATRQDGLPLLAADYGIHFGTVATYADGIKYRSLVSEKVDAAIGYETDGDIARDHLVPLVDDRQIWPPYHAVPVVASDFAKRAGPAFSETLDSVSALLTTHTMQALNDQVVHGHQDPAAVAKAFLQTHGLVKMGPRPTISIGSKDFTEQFVLADLYSQALQARGFPVQQHLDLGSTAVADAALQRGQIGMYPEYDGTALTTVLKGSVHAGESAQDVYEATQAGYAKRGMHTLAPTAFSDGNAIVVTQATAARYHLITLSDLAKVAGKLRFGEIPGFDTRPDGLPLLSKTYGIHFRSTGTYADGIKYSALVGGTIDAVYGFETDGQIQRDHLVVLRDDRYMWPPYQAVPVISDRLAKQVGPDFAATVDAVSGLLTAQIMQTLNAKVDQDKQDPADVARDFLRANGLLGS